MLLWLPLAWQIPLILESSDPAIAKSGSLLRAATSAARWHQLITATIKNADRHRAIGQRACPNLAASCWIVFHASCLFAERILIDGQYFIIGQKG